MHSPARSEGWHMKAATFSLALFTSGLLLDSAVHSGPSPAQLILPGNVLTDLPRGKSLH